MRDNDRSAIGRIADLLGGVAGRVIVAALLILIMVELGRFCYSFGRSIFYQETMEEAPGTDIVVTFDEGCSVDEAAGILEENGIIRDATAFTIQALLYETHIYPGDYTLNTSMTTKEIIAEINISEEEYQARLLASEQQADETEIDSDVIGGGDEAEELSPEEMESLEELASESAENTDD